MNKAVFYPATRAARSLVIAATALAVTPLASAMESMPAGETRLSEAQVREKYQNCPNGYYTGPRPGKARYTRDRFLWVVTPEFARKFCMPPEFVSPELKGAEAVAFRIVEDADEERCGWGGREEVCYGSKELRFEIYLDEGIKLPKKHPLKTSVRFATPSTMLIATSPREWERLHKEHAERGGKPREGSVWPAFDLTQFGLNGVKEGKVVWPIVQLREYVYLESTFRGINYLALQGSTGFLPTRAWRRWRWSAFSSSFVGLGDKQEQRRALRR